MSFEEQVGSESSDPRKDLLKSLEKTSDEHLRFVTWAAAAYRQSAIPEYRRQAALVDVVHEIPEIAIQAFRGFAISEDFSERIVAAAALPRLYLLNRDITVQLLTQLAEDEHEQVRSMAVFSIGELLDSRARWEGRL